MATLTDNLLPRHAIAVLAVNALALIAFALSPVGQQYPMLALGIVAFLGVQAFLPACRIRFDMPICPANLAQGFYWVQLVLMALLIGYFGVSLGTLPYLPSQDALNMAIGINVIGYVSFCCAYQWCSNDVAGSAGDRKNWEQRRMADASHLIYLVPLFACVGIVGLFLLHGSVAGIIEYVSSPAQHRLNEAEPATLATAAGTFLRHFLGFAIVLAWSIWVGRIENRRTFAVAAVTLITAIALTAANFTYNRGAMLGPVLALAAAYSAHVVRIPFRSALIGAVLALAAAFTFGWYRSTDLDISELSTAQLDDTWHAESVVEFAQVYASGPQLSAFLIDELDYERKFYWGQTLLPSIVYPVPVLGKPYREMSGIYLFNYRIYGDPDVLDQVIPLAAELFINFHLPGVVLGHLLLGWGVAYLQRRFASATPAVESYSWLLLSLWTIFPGSIPVVSQMYFYSFWPIYVYALVKVFACRSDAVSEPIRTESLTYARGTT